jgi:CheY-like chemotaxis protein
MLATARPLRTLPHAHFRTKKANMLIAEDRHEDIELLKLASRRANLKAALHFVRDGEQVIQYLMGTGDFIDRSKNPTPKLLLLDLKMPRTDGFQVLQWLRTQPRLKRLCVVVLTTSNVQRDINRAFDLGANSYIVKPSHIERLEQLLKTLEHYWTELNQSPEYD